MPLSFDEDYPERPKPVSTTCKHMRGKFKCDCPRCGTTSLRDSLHTTKRGKGVVAQIKKR